MTETDHSALRQELKEMIVEETDQDVVPSSIGDDEPLFGRNSSLDLDSLDGLQISMALQSRYGVVITDPKQVRRLLVSVRTLADYLHKQRTDT